MKYHYSEALKDKEMIFKELDKIEEALEDSNTTVKMLTSSFDAEGKFAESLKTYLEEVNINFVNRVIFFIDKYKEEYNNLLDKVQAEVDTSNVAVLYEKNIENIKKGHMNYSIELRETINDYNKSCGKVSKYISSSTKHVNEKSRDTLDKMINKMEEFSHYDSRGPIDQEYWAIRKFTNYMNGISLSGYKYNSGDINKFMAQYTKDPQKYNDDILKVADNTTNVASVLAELNKYQHMGRFEGLGVMSVLLGTIADFQSGEKNFGGAIYHNGVPYATTGFLATLSGVSGGVWGPAVAYTHQEMYNKNYTYKDIADHGLDLVGNAYGYQHKEIQQMKDAGYIYSYKEGYFVKEK